ncbi:MAG: M14 family metallocarboxypeptidase [Clostridia bacterium]|nr:M14 family metallocarboxypeptidase [Clostridia bacterium]
MDYITKPQAMTTENQRKLIFSLQTAYPALQVRTVGRSLCGRPIYALEIGRSADPLLIAAGTHGQEWLTCLLALRFAEALLRAQAENRLLWLAEGRSVTRSVIIVPCVNPDGVEIALRGPAAAGDYAALVASLLADSDADWNANARGVDINHNFDADWEKLRQLEIASGITGPAPRRYGGEAPESEPETQTLTALCRARLPRMAIALHSQGREIYWRYGEIQPPDSRVLAELFSAASGYRLSDNAGLASYGGFKDWFIAAFNRPGFTVEIGEGTNPLPLTDFPQIWAETLPLLTLAALL